VRTTERHQLKQDKFATTAAETYSWAAEHRDKLLWGAVAVAAVLAIVIGISTYTSSRNERANLDLAEAMRSYNATIGPSNPAQPSELTFATTADRAKAAHQKFEQVADKYSSTAAGKISRYMGGVTAVQMGDNAMAERELKRAIDDGGSDVAALARMALAGVYRSTGKESQAADQYKYVIDHPTNSVGKGTAQLELASMYEQKQPTEAIRIYQQVQKEDAQSAAAQTAGARLSTLKPQ
jgi:predicted negative regulator of RcsB-dependent stress response